jgi:hypothetical protein
MAVRLVVYGSARGSVRLSGSAVVCGSVLGSVWQCTWQVVAVLCGCGCGSLAVCGGVRQLAAVRAAVCGGACGSVCAVVWGSVHGTSLRAVCVKQLGSVRQCAW